MENIHVGKIIKQISIGIEKSTNNLLRSKDITATQGVVLLRLKQNKDGMLAIKELEKCFATAQSTMYGVISRLENKGFITTSLDNKKNKVAQITEEGITLCEYIEKCIEESEREMFSCLTKTEYSILLELMLKIQSSSIPCGL